MDDKTAKRMVLGGIALAVVATEVKRIKGGDGPTIGPVVGGFLAAAALTAVAGPAPDVAGGLAAIVAITALIDAGPEVIGTVTGSTKAGSNVRQLRGSGAADGLDYRGMAKGNKAIDGLLLGLGTVATAGASNLMPGTTVPTGGGIVTWRSANGRSITSSTTMRAALEPLILAAKADGIVLHGGCWRSPEEQRRLYAKNCDSAGNCNPPTARPGTSMHEKGEAIDFEGIGRSGAGNPKFEWLQRNAGRYGLYNLPSEGWHWSLNGH